MSDIKTITGVDEEAIWQQVSADLLAEELLEYDVVIELDGRYIELDIDIDLGGGFESGFETTRFTSILSEGNQFNFAIHKQGFLEEIGKFFGMQDIVIGFAEFDKHFIVKSNDEARIKSLLADEETRQFFETLTADFTFGTTVHQDKKMLELTIDKGITDPAALKPVFHYFNRILKAIDSSIGEL